MATKPKKPARPKLASNAEPKLPESLFKYYAISDAGQSWSLWCTAPGCKRGWRVDKPPYLGVVSTGSILHLLNHAYSHGSKHDRYSED